MKKKIIVTSLLLITMLILGTTSVFALTCTNCKGTIFESLAGMIEIDDTYHGRYNKCANCGRIVYSERATHTYGSWSNNGFNTTHTRKCKECGHSQSESHTYGSWYKYNESTHRYDCSKCSSYGSGSHNGTATCTDAAYCSICRNSWGSALDHQWNAGQITTPATCSAKGIKTYTCLRDSSHTKTESVDIDVNNHDYNRSEITTAATCTTKGVRTYYCSRNSAHTKTEDVDIDSNNHNYNRSEITTVATCTTKGVRTYYCSRNSAHTKAEDVDIDSNNHDFSLPCPTCGQANIKCSRCDKIKDHLCDKIAPVITVTPTENSVYQKTNEVTITVNDEGGSGLASINAYEYYLSNSATALSDGIWTRYINGGKTIIGAGKTGKYYLFIKRVSDSAGNVSTTTGTSVTISGTAYQRFGTFMLDNEMPTPGTLITKYKESDTTSTYVNGEKARADVYLSVANGSDRLSGHKETTYKIYKDGKEIPKVNILTTNGTYVIKVFTEDNAGNIAEQPTQYIVQISKPVETKITIKNLRDDGIGIVSKVTVRIVEEIYENGIEKYIERVSPIETMINANNQNEPIIIKKGLTSGNYKAQITLRDKLGNERTIETAIFTVK